MFRNRLTAFGVLMLSASLLAATRSSTLAPGAFTTSSLRQPVVGPPPRWKGSTTEIHALHPSPPHVSLDPDSIELYWDDGSCESIWWVQAPRGARDYFAVRFTPPVASYTGLSCRIMGTHDGTASFAECTVCPGTASAPDLDSCYRVLSNEPTMPVYPTIDWAYVDFPDATVYTAGPLWLVAHWPSGSAHGPYVAGDINSPDGCSFWTMDGTVWNVWSADDSGMRVSIDVAFEYGAIEGTVSEMGGGPIQDALVTADGYADTTDAAGRYFLEVLVGTYDMTATAFGHNPATVPGVVVGAGDTVTVSFDLTYPEISVRPSSFCYVVMSPGPSIDTTLYICNTGNGPLQFDISLVGGDSIALGDSVFGFPINESGYGVGVEFAWNEFFVTANDSVHVYDRDGNWLRAFEQSISPGWRDLAFDGDTLWAAADDLVKFGRNGQIYGYLPVGIVGRALAYDPATGHFWTANFSSPIYEFDKTGAIHNTYANTWGIYGMGLDDVSQYAPSLWVGEQTTPGVRRFDPTSGTYDPGAWFGLPDIAGGTAVTPEWDPSLVILVQLVQSSPDRIVLYGVGTAPPTWLDANPRSGSVAAGDTFQVTVNFNSAGLTAGIHTGELRIMNNSATPEVAVPCTLKVLTGAQRAVKPPSLPRAYVLSQNSPNPTSGSTVIAYQIPARSHVSLDIYDATGRLVRSLMETSLEPGYYGTIWDGRDSAGSRVASGVYFYTLCAATLDGHPSRTDIGLDSASPATPCHFTSTRKAIVLR